MQHLIDLIVASLLGFSGGVLFCFLYIFKDEEE